MAGRKVQSTGKINIKKKTSLEEAETVLHLSRMWGARPFMASQEVMCGLCHTCPCVFCAGKCQTAGSP